LLIPGRDDRAMIGVTEGPSPLPPTIFLERPRRHEQHSYRQQCGNQQESDGHEPLGFFTSAIVKSAGAPCSKYDARSSGIPGANAREPALWDPRRDPRQRNGVDGGRRQRRATGARCSS
jgi:hypothetical protein